MKLTRKFKLKGNSIDLEILIKANTRNLTKEESHDKFESRIDKIIIALLDFYYHSNIKEIK